MSDAGAAATEGTGGAARGTIDLHAHTTASDGLATPERFVAAAVQAGLAAIAVTDHDTVAGVEPVMRLAPPALRIVPGVELSVHDERGKEIHMLGLHLADLASMEPALVSVREARKSRGARIVEKLNAAGVALSMDAVLAEAAGGALGRPHVARALMKAGTVKSLQEAFDRWLGAGRVAYVEKERLSIATGIDLIHRAGGIAVYAHPGTEGTRERIAPMVDAGLDGVEVRHPSHGAEEIKRLRNLVNGLGIVPSGGSDWHGAEAGPRTLGCMHVAPEWLERQLARVAARPAA